MNTVPEILKKNFFLSCWSKETKEMIPQWAMYAPKGIRIELPINWYNKFKIPVEGRRDIASFSEILDENHPGPGLSMTQGHRITVSSNERDHLPRAA